MTPKKLINLHLDTIGWLLIALTVLVPLVLWPKTSEVFEFNKILITYLLGGTTLLTFVSLAFFTQTNPFKRTPLDIPIAIFLISQLLATLFSIHPATSIWGYYSRFHGGLLSYLTYAVIYYMFVSYSHLLSDTDKNPPFFTRHKFLNYFLQALTLTGGLVAFYGILEHFGIDKHIWVQDVQSRVFSTLGQPNWLSAYLVALIPVTTHLFVKSKDIKQKIYWATLTTIYFTAILYTKSRSGIGTTLIIFALYFAYTFFKSASKRSLTNLRPLAILILPILAVAIITGTPWSPTPGEFQHRLNVGGPLLSETEPYLNKIGLSSEFKPLETEKLPPETQDLIAQRSQGVRVGGTDSFEIRKVVWEGAINLFKRRPLFGTGVETFGYSYYWERPKAHNMLSEWDFLYNKAHNEYLNFLATTGFVGFAAYTILLLAIAKILWSNPNKSKLTIPLLFGFVSILITNYFGFSVVVIGIYLFLFPAVALYATSDDPATRLKTPILVTGSNYFWMTTFIGASLLLTLSIYRIWSADIHYSMGKTYLDLGYVAQSITDLEQAVSLNTNEPNYHSILAEGYATAALSLHQKSLSATQSATASSKTIAAQSNLFETRAVDTIEKARSLNPYHLNHIKSKVKVEIILSEINKKYLQTSLQTLNEAITLSPTDPKLIYNLGLVYEQLGQLESARLAYQKALDLKPDYQVVVQDLERVTKNLEQTSTK